MSHSLRTLEDLQQRRPEWQPWFGVVAEMLRARAASEWEPAVPRVESHAQGPAPLLHGTRIAVPAGALGRLCQRLLDAAARSGTDALATLGALRKSDLDGPALFRAALRGQGETIRDVATAASVDAGALQAVMSLLPIPFLQACHTRLGRVISPVWMESYCPLCAAGPALVEVRGIERSRFCRCGRCGSAWPAQHLRCAYCATSDHHQLVTLLAEDGHSRDVVDACLSCRGYVKAVTRLQGCAPDAVLLEDLATVDLDLAALEAGYHRPDRPAYPLDVTVVEEEAPRRFFGWPS